MVSPLISADELAADLAAGPSSVTVLDVRYRMGGPGGRAEFEAGHVPAAAYVDLDADLAAPPGAGGRHPLPSTAAFQSAMRRVGVRDDRPVVVYDDWSGLAAGRAWWLLRYHGHQDVRLLDGAWPAWVASGGAVQAVTVPPEPGDFTARPGALPVVEADGVLDVPVLVDARALERYRGEVEPIDPVAGHIPGAVNVPTTTNLRADGRFRSPEELRALYAAAGVSGDEDVAVYCGSGVTAVHDIVALEVAGIRAALYPGSWSGWITDPSRPVER
ncbi:sulfurtransferase [Nocardioides sp. T2.26MG-1]|uniref:sulfurtransferase n=1 Tax=Nocardioides sp. T2.26MG-1 TaxID=3041166 RepID=UPI002477C6ED|nr:sulfurtransferase [Nocardioides sp. T2.26MG-1]CAI9413078.1 Putative thiosulfate sulfurtransferase SseB [Nocardioides sp. T2.26MG-1]